MTSETAQKNKATLLRERDQVESEIRQLREFMRTEVDFEVDEADAEVSEREKNQALINVLENRLHHIGSALRSIESGQYGICERCKQPIGEGRLEVMPDATLCVKCQGEIERRNRRGTSRSSW